MSTSLTAAQGSANDVDFIRDIAPILVTKCAPCHRPEKIKGGYQLHTYGAFLTAGRSKEPPIVPGNPQKSHLFQLLLARDPDDRMPQNDDPLPAEQIARIRNWIEGGARATGIDPDKTLASLITSERQPAPPPAYPRAVPILALAFHPNGSELAAGGYHEVIVWDSKSGHLVRRIQNVARQVQQISYSPDGRLLAVAAGTAGKLGEVKVFDSRSGKLLRTAASASDLMTSVSFSPDGRYLAMGGADNKVSVVEAEGETPVFRTELNADWVMQLAFSPDGHHLASASRDKTVRLLDAKSGELDETYAGHGGAVFAVAFGADGTNVLSGGRDRSIHLWQANDGKKLADSGTLPAEIVRMILFKDQLVAGLSDGEVRAYRVQGKRIEFVRTIGRHGDAVGALAVEAKQERLASAGFDGRIRVWNLRQPALESEFSGMPGL